MGVRSYAGEPQPGATPATEAPVPATTAAPTEADAARELQEWLVRIDRRMLRDLSDARAKLATALYSRYRREMIQATTRFRALTHPEQARLYPQLMGAGGLLDTATRAVTTADDILLDTVLLAVRDLLDRAEAEF